MRVEKVGIALTMGCMALLRVAPANAYTVGKECIESFSACGATNLPQACDLTDNAGAFGGTLSFYWTNNNVWETDLRDRSLGGFDHQWADAVQVYLFSGHGTSNGSDDFLGLLIPGSGCVHASSGTTQRILFDRFAELVFLDASCSGSFPERFAVWYEGGGNGMMIDLKQGFGFMNSPADTEYRYFKHFYYSAQGMSNAQAWLEAGDGCIGVAFCDDESPIAFTKGNSAADAEFRADFITLFNFTLWTPPTGNSYHWWRVNNGGC